MKHFVRNLLILIPLLISLSLVSCKEDDSISVSPSEVSIVRNGGKKTLNVTANCAWTLAAPEWLECEPVSGSGNGTVTVKAAKNDELERKDFITFTGGTAMAQVSVTQAGVDFRATKDLFEFDAAGTPIEFTVISTYDWTITASNDAQWCKAEPSSGTAGETKVTLTPEPITDRTPRNRTFITVDYGKSFKTLTVSQQLPNESPSVPELVSPAADAKDVKINSYFSWKKSVDPDGDEVTYKLMLSADGGTTWASTSTDAIRTKHSALLAKSTEYIWKVEASDPFGGKSESETRTFITGDGGAYKDGEVTTYRMESAGASKPVHLIFMGDGFIEDDYTEGGAFDQAVETAVNGLFAVEPFATYQDYFRVTTVAVYSQERGATVKAAMSNCPAQTKNTAFSATLDGGNSTGTSCNYDKVFSYAMKVPGVDDAALKNTTVYLLINLNVYAGTCMMEYSGRSVSMCPMGKSSFVPVVCHEGGGHGFGRLLDEYRYYEAQLPLDQKNSLIQWRSGDPYFGYNIDITGDRNIVHWKEYFNRSGYEAVGLYEGAYLYYQGVWRSEYISCMHDNRFYFNAPSREAIVRRIMKASGSNFNIDSFVKNDKVKKDPTTKSNYVEEAYPPLAPPILVNK